jgi:hypothetical protein
VRWVQALTLEARRPCTAAFHRLRVCSVASVVRHMQHHWVAGAVATEVRLVSPGPEGLAVPAQAAAAGDARPSYRSPRNHRTAARAAGGTGSGTEHIRRNQDREPRGPRRQARMGEEWTAH